MRSVVFAFAAVVLSACATTGPAARAARAQQNTAVVLAFVDMVYNRHEVGEAFKLYVGAEYRQHNPVVADGREAAIKALTQFTHELHPELHAEVKRTVAQGDLVAVHLRVIRSGAEREGGHGSAMIDVFRLEHGRIVEHWDVVQDVPEKSANDNTMF
jgi:predicted SnoaL-like aldol condensation-catalyzing enzyme